MAENDTERDPLVDWPRVLVGALAAVSSAVLLSTLGAVGTLAGAALGSIVVSVSSSVYAQGLNRSRRRMAQAQEAALRRVGVAQAELHRVGRRSGSGHTAPEVVRARSQLAEARQELATTPPPTSLRHRVTQLPWKRIAVVSAPMFVIAIVAITLFEVVAGRPVSSFTGGTHTHHGTSFSNLDGSGNSPASPSPSPSPPAPTPSPVTPTGSTSPSPSTSPSSSPSTAPAGPPSATPTPSGAPTGQSTLPSAAPTPGG